MKRIRRFGFGVVGLAMLIAVGPAGVVAQTLTGNTLSYQGRLTSGGGAATGIYDFQFQLYNLAAGGTSLATINKNDVQVTQGLFQTELDCGSTAIFTGNQIWIAIGVRPGTSTGAYTALSPRQKLSATPYALGLRPGTEVRGAVMKTLACKNPLFDDINSCAFYAEYHGPSPYLNLGPAAIWANSDSFLGLLATTDNAAAILAQSKQHIGVLGYSEADEYPAIEGNSPSCVGVHGVSGSRSGYTISFRKNGVFGESAKNTGVCGASKDWYGVEGRSSTYYGVYGISDSAVYASGAFENQAGAAAINAWNVGMTRDNATIKATNYGTDAALAGYFVNNSNFATAHFCNQSTGEVLYLQNGGDATGTGGGEFIRCVNNGESDTQFSVRSNGDVYADGTFHTPAADFAEWLPCAGPCEPGDVLAIAPDGRLTRSSAPGQETVAGVYSTQPAFLGGSGGEGSEKGKAPLAVVGVVPVKASAENGPIRPGDLLIASSMPGHAMRGQGVEQCFGRTLGKALAPLEQGTGTIKMLVHSR